MGVHDLPNDHRLPTTAMFKIPRSLVREGLRARYLRGIEPICPPQPPSLPPRLGGGMRGNELHHGGLGVGIRHAVEGAGGGPSAAVGVGHCQEDCLEGVKE
eukprot:569621-Prorocentrum_minimum.AAC.2